LLWPILLVGLGVILLMNNLGVTAVDVWELLVRYWPLLLIAGGIDILFLRSGIWGSLLAGVLILAILVGGVLLLEARPLHPAEMETVRQSRNGIERAEIVLKPAVGSLHLSTLDGASEDLIHGDVARGYDERAVQSFDKDRDPPRFELRSEGWWMFPPLRGWGSGWTWDLTLNPEMNSLVNVDMGVGKAELDLGAASIEELEVNLGVGQVIVRLPSKGRFHARIEGGVGESVVFIPEGLDVRVRLDTALTQIDLPSGYVQTGQDTYTSPGFEGAENRVELTIHQAIGSVRIR
jgi:hypothetical protein